MIVPDLNIISIKILNIGSMKGIKIMNKRIFLY